MQRCQNYGNDVFYGFFIHFYVTHLIFPCAPLNVFRAHSPSPRLISHTLIVSRFLQQVSRRKKGRLTITCIYWTRESSMLKLTLFFWKEKLGRFSNLSWIELHIWPCKQRLHPQSDFFLAVGFLAKAKTKTCHQFF